jgi:hypothetical protein
MHAVQRRRIDLMMLWILNCGILLHISAKKHRSSGIVVGLTGLLFTLHAHVWPSTLDRKKWFIWKQDLHWCVQWRWRHAHSTHWRLWRCVITVPLYRRRALRSLSQSLLRTVWLQNVCLLRPGFKLAVCKAGMKRSPRCWNVLKQSCCGVVTLGAHGFCLSDTEFVARKRW